MGSARSRRLTLLQIVHFTVRPLTWMLPLAFDHSADLHSRRRACRRDAVTRLNKLLGGAE
jgi:hypothetical protein